MRRPFLLAGFLALVPTVLAAQDAPPAPPRTQGDSQFFPQPRMVEGQPFETRPPEKADDKPLFPEQTRAPYHKVAGYKVTTVTDKLAPALVIAFLPDGKMLVTEKFPADIRIVSADGTLSEPLTGIDGLAPPKNLGLLDVVLAPDFEKSHRVYFSFFKSFAQRQQQHLSGPWRSGRRRQCHA